MHILLRAAMNPFMPNDSTVKKNNEQNVVTYEVWFKSITLISCAVCCGLSSLLIAVVGRLYSVIMALPGHLDFM